MWPALSMIDVALDVTGVVLVMVFFGMFFYFAGHGQESWVEDFLEVKEIWIDVGKDHHGDPLFKVRWRNGHNDVCYAGVFATKEEALEVVNEIREDHLRRQHQFKAEETINVEVNGDAA